MQFNLIAVAAVLASVASAQSVVTVYACSSTAVPTYSGVVAPTGTVGSTGVVSAPTSTGSPIPYVANGASAKGVSALGLIVAGGVALLL